MCSWVQSERGRNLLPRKHRSAIRPVRLSSLRSPTTVALVGVINFIGATRDISSIALLASNDTNTISLLQLDYMIDGRSEPAAVLSVVVIALTTGVAFIARFLGLKVGIRAQATQVSPR